MEILIIIVLIGLTIALLPYLIGAVVLFFTLFTVFLGIIPTLLREIVRVWRKRHRE